MYVPLTNLYTYKKSVCGSMEIKKKPIMFIASSKECKKYVEAMENEFFHDDFLVIPWYRLFDEPLSTTIEQFDEINNFDFATVIMTPDDITISRGENTFSPRDNLILELGLLIGSIGKNRVFPVVPKDMHIKFPSDLLGTNPFCFRFSRGYRRIRDFRQAVSVACNNIRDKIEFMGCKDSLIKDNSSKLVDVGEPTDNSTTFGDQNTYFPLSIDHTYVLDYLIKKGRFKSRESALFEVVRDYLDKIPWEKIDKSEERLQQIKYKLASADIAEKEIKNFLKH